MSPSLLPVAIAQIAPHKGDYPANLRRLATVFAQLDDVEPRPRVLHLAETALTGYLLEGGVREVALTAGSLARDLDLLYRGAAPGRPPLDVAVGFYELWRGTLHNSAMYVRLGEGDGPRVLHVHRKNFLPTYGLFDEERFVERGLELQAFDTEWGRAGLLVCEDAWHSLTGTVLALDGAEVVFVCAAAPGRGLHHDRGAPTGPGNVARWERLTRDIAEEHGVFVSLANLVGSEGGKLFIGSSIVADPKGDVVLAGPPWDEALLPVTLDLRDVARARADAPMLADLRVQLPHLLRSIDAAVTGAPRPVAQPENGGRTTTVPFDAATGATAEDHALVHPDPGAPCGGPLPVVRSVVERHSPLGIDPQLTEQWLVRFIREELRQRGFEKAVVGISGGLDSAVTAFLAARAIGPKNVLGVRMPYRTSSPDSLAHGQLVIDALGIESRTVDISDAVDGYLKHEPDADGTRRGNVMARLRMITLFDLSSKHRAIPLGTGNKTERLFGYFTWHADDSPPVNPLGDLYKTQVWALARHLGVPAAVVDKAPSADLVAGQTDEGDFGISYGRADIILHHLLTGVTPAELAERGFEPAEVEVVRRRLEGTHWKRRLPTVALLSQTAIGESYLRPVDY